MSLLKQCWRCWPKECRCSPSDNEIEQMKSDIYLLDQELQRENRRAREFAEMLKVLSFAIWKFREDQMQKNGLDGVPAELFDLGQQAQQAEAMLKEERNQDRVSDLYSKMIPAKQEPA